MNDYNFLLEKNFSPPNDGAILSCFLCEMICSIHFIELGASLQYW